FPVAPHLLHLLLPGLARARQGRLGGMARIARPRVDAHVDHHHLPPRDVGPGNRRVQAPDHAPAAAWEAEGLRTAAPRSGPFPKGPTGRGRFAPAAFGRSPGYRKTRNTADDYPS